MSYFSKILILSIPLFFTCNCATVKITAQRLVPARPDAPQIKTIALLGFTAYADREERIGDQVEAAVHQRLQESNFLQLIEKPEITWSKGHDQYLTWRDKWQRVKKEVNADAILIGELDLAEVRGKPFLSVSGKEAALVLTFHLINVDDGHRLSDERLMERRIVNPEPFDGKKTPLPSDEELMTELVDRAAQKIVQSFSPQILEEQIELIHNRKTNEGVGLAKEGEWAAAVEAWEQALKIKPRSHELHYNIGAAHEFLGLLESSEKHLKKAIEIKRVRLYRRALERVQAALEKLKEESSHTTVRKDRLKNRLLQSS